MFRRIFLNFVKLRKGNQQFGKTQTTAFFAQDADQEYDYIYEDYYVYEEEQTPPPPPPPPTTSRPRHRFSPNTRDRQNFSHNTRDRQNFSPNANTRERQNQLQEQERNRFLGDSSPALSQGRSYSAHRHSFFAEHVKMSKS